MSGLVVFSSEIERAAALAGGTLHGVETGICGVGLIDAAIGSARLIDRHAPDYVIFAGTAGVHRASNVQVGSLTVAYCASIGTGDVADGLMRIPTLLPDAIPSDTELVSLLAGADGDPDRLSLVHVGCTLGITESDELAARLHKYDGSDLENLELFSVLRAAEGVPAAGMLGVTNVVGVDGGLGWKNRYVEMMERIGDRLRALLPLDAAALKRENEG